MADDVDVSAADSSDGSLAEVQMRLLNAQEQLRKEHDELRYIQAQLRESQRRYADLFEYAPVGYVTLDRDGFIREINSAAASLLRAPASEIRSTSFADHIASTDAAKFSEYFQNGWNASDRTGIEISIRKRNGSIFPAQLTIAPTREIGDGHVELRMTIVDLTELKRTQRALQRAKEGLESRVEERTAELRRANNELSAEVARRNRLEAELLEISEREKRRFGQDLHDETCQSLAGLGLLATVIAREISDCPISVQEKMERLSHDLRVLVEQTRSIAHGLHPVTLSGGLVVALRELVEHVRERLPCTLHVVDAPRLSEEQELALYRIAQEASHNAVRHARATQMVITLRVSGYQLLLSVEDDGVGLPAKKRSGYGQGMGLDIMEYRARSIGALFTIESKAQQGTRVNCLVSCVQSNGMRLLQHTHKH